MAWPCLGQPVPFSQSDSWHGNRELGAQAEQINRRIVSASSWRLAMGSEPVLLTPGHSQCRSKGGGKKDPLS